MAEISEKQLKVLEKLIGDEEFRTGFFEDPDAAVAKAGIELNEEELAGLKGLDFGMLGTTLTDLDARLSKSAGVMDVASSVFGVVQSLVTSQTT